MPDLSFLKRGLASAQEPNAWSEEQGYYFEAPKTYISESGQQLPTGSVDSREIFVQGNPVKPTEAAKPLSDEISSTAASAPKLGDSKAQELINKYNISRILETNKVSPDILNAPIDTKAEAEPMTWGQAALGLIPVGIDIATGGRGSALPVASNYYKSELATNQAKKTRLEDRLLELEKARQLAAIKYAGKGTKTPNLELKEVDVNGDPIFVPEQQAIGQKSWKKISEKKPEEMSWKEKQEYLYGLKGKLEKGKLDAKAKSEITKYENAEFRAWEDTKTTQDTKKMSAAYKNLVSVDPNKKEPMAQLAIVFDFMRTLDPDSTVREGEQALVFGAKSIRDVLSNIQDLITKEQKLTPEQVRGIQKFAAMRYVDRLGTQEQLVNKEYRDRAKRYGWNEQNIVGNVSVGTPMVVSTPSGPKIENVPDSEVEKYLKKGYAKLTPEFDVRGGASGTSAPMAAPVNRAMNPRPQMIPPVSSKRPTFEEWKASKGL
jgi:hypothetical protein